MPTLNWIGKEKVINHHLYVPFHTLNEEYSFENGVQKTPQQKSEASSSLSFGEGWGEANKIIHADNLLALKSLLPEYEGRIKCIYIDPPYNTGNEGWVYNDNVNDPKMKKWLGQVVGKEAEDLTRHDKWLCMMYPRLKLLHKLLSDDGAIFISIDDNEQANLKLLCDEIFGSANFVVDFIWKKKGGVSNTEKYIGRITEHILCYAKKVNDFNPNRKEIDKKFPFKDENGNYTLEGLLKTDEGEYKRDTMKYGITEPKSQNTIFPPAGKRWIIGEKKKDELLAKNLLAFSYDKNKNLQVKLKKYDEGIFSVVYYNLLEDLGSLANAKNELNNLGFNREDFPTPKPSELVTEIFKIATDKNSIILDSFAGSGTTAHAVLNLNKQDGGNRKFILVEMENYAETITAERVKRVINGYGKDLTSAAEVRVSTNINEMVSEDTNHGNKDLTPALSKREGEIQNASKEVEGTGGGFTYYTLGETVLDEEHNLNAKLALHKIHQYIWYAETHAPYTAKATAEGYLGKFNETGIYFHYTPDEVTTLDDAYLMHVKQKAEQYIIYADMCLLSDKFLLKHNIIFKKIPRDISKL